MAERFSWTGPDGSVIDLSDTSAGYLVSGEGTTGLRSPAYKVSSVEYAGLDGEQLQSIKAAAGNPSLGVEISAGSRGEFRVKARDLVRRMRPKPGPGVLTATDETGASRSLSCYCIGGTEGDASPSAGLPGVWWRLVLKLYAPDPWWYGPTQTISQGLGAGSAFFPILPMRLASSSVQGSFTVDLSDADAPSWPRSVVQGPGNGLVLANNTSGLSLSLDAVLGVGESMVINTQPGSQSVRKGDGTNLLTTLTPGTDPALWPLIEGVNKVSAVLTGATSESRIILQYAPRYAGI